MSAVIEVSEKFEVPAPALAVWSVLSDPHAVVSCVPGASLGEQQENGAFAATLAVKFGPTKVTFRALVELELDADAFRGTLTATGRDTLGGARMQASATFSVNDKPDKAGSEVSLHGTVEITGRLASLIEGGATVVAKRMAAEFAGALAVRCTEAQNNDIKREATA